MRSPAAARLWDIHSTLWASGFLIKAGQWQLPVHHRASITQDRAGAGHIGYITMQSYEDAQRAFW